MLEPTGDALYHESFIIYNRPLRSGKIEVYNKANREVKIVEGKVGTEYNDDAVNSDIKSMRFRMRLEENEIYTVYVKDVIDKEGNKIEDYRFTFTTVGDMDRI